MNPGYSEPSSEEVSTAIPLEIDEETAARADDILREFAEEAGLETALIVDRSGALVSGISAEEEVSVEVISALVAGASGAMRALVLRLGETGAIESFHIGGNRLVYLKEIINRFILVAVADSDRPAGAVRQKALAIEPRLDLLLLAVTPKEAAPTIRPQTPVRSLREIARERTAMREAGVLAAVAASESLPEELPDTDFGIPEEDTFVEDYPAEVGVEDSFETLELTAAEEVMEKGTADPQELDAEAEEAEEAETDLTEAIEPREIHEPLEFGEPEIVVETSEHPVFAPPTLPIPVDSPFEAEEEEEGDFEDDSLTGGSESPDEEWYEIEEEEQVFEIEEEDGVEIFQENGESASLGEQDDGEAHDFATMPDSPTSLFELDAHEEEGDEDGETVAAVADPSGTDDRSPAGMNRPESLFELAEDDDFEDEEEWTPFEAWDAEEEDEDEDGEEAGEDQVFELDEEEFEEEDEGDEEFGGEESSGESDHEVFEEMIAEEDSETEIRNSGPFYF